MGGDDSALDDGGGVDLPTDRCEGRFRSIGERFDIDFDDAAIAMSVTHPDGRYLWTNRAFSALVGYDRATLLTMRLQDLTHPDDVREADEETKAALRRGARSVFVDKRYVHAEGHVIDVRVTTAFVGEENGRPAYFFTQVQDVSELVSARRAAHAGQRRLERIIASSTNGYLEIDVHGVVRAWNPAAEIIFGWSAEQALGREAAELIVPPETRQAYRESLDSFREHYRGRLSHSFELEARTRDRGTVPVQIVIWTIEDPREEQAPGSGPDDLAGSGPRTLHMLVQDISERRRAQEVMRRHSRIFSTIKDAVVVTDLDGRIVDANPAVGEVFGRAPETLIGTIRHRLLGGEAARRAGGAGIAFDEVLETARDQGQWTGDVPFLRPDGGTGVSEATVCALYDDHQRVVGAVEVHRDVTQARETAHALRQAEQRWRLTLDNAPIGIALAELSGSLLRVNTALCRIVGYSEDELLGRSLREITHPDDVQVERPHQERLHRGEVDRYTLEKRYLHAEGHEVWVHVSVGVVCDESGAPLHVIGQIEDITDRRVRTEQLRDLALRDPLTGLANRTRFLAELDDALARLTPDSLVAVLFLDLDGFKEINDTHGHPAGDRALVLAAQRLERAVRPVDLAARFGGDEFAVLLPTLPKLRDARSIAARVLHELNQPVTLNPKLCVTLGASLGIAVTDDHTRSGPDLLASADRAMYVAKRQGKNTYAVA